MENVLIMRTPVQQEEQLSMRTLANESLSKRYPVTEMTTEQGQMGELVKEDTGQHSDKKTPPSPSDILEELLTIVRDVRTRAKTVRKSPKLLRYKGRRKLAAVRSARTEGVSIG